MRFWPWRRAAPPSSPSSEASPEGERQLHAPAAATASARPVDAAPPLAPDLARLLAFGEPGGPLEVEALALLRAVRRTPDEGLALDGLLQSGAAKPLPEALAIAVALALVDRGERSPARALLQGAEGLDALMLRADLLADEADFAGAVAMIERVLVRDLDVPGARERRLAWRTRLGLGESDRRADPATMTVATPHARTPFDLLREVARGGAGVVFEARDRELGRPVAVKLYHQPERDRSQLLHEGRVAAALEGPGIVRVFDIEPNEGWLALEWASEGALRDLLARARVPAATEARAALAPLSGWVPELVGALARVHAAGWVHHDVKPANVLMSREPGRAAIAPWLADFGSARRAGEPSPPGSLGFVSPERLAGRASDPRDDVYGFGRVLEEVLAVGAGEGSEADALARWRAIAAACVGPSDARPSDGGALAELLARGR